MQSKYLPQHVAFIPDGNRRWAREKGLPTLIGHREGYKALEPLVNHAITLGIPYLTFWALSTENLKRDKKEVTYLLKLLRSLFKGQAINRLKKKGVKFQVIGQVEELPDDIQAQVKELMQDTESNKTITVNIGLGYGGRAEILRAVNAIIKDKHESVDEKMFSSYLFTKNQPDPDLIIRAGGEFRLSGFLPWQGVYSELYFTEMYWPEFDMKAFDEALEEFARRNRRFGK